MRSLIFASFLILLAFGAYFSQTENTNRDSQLPPVNSQQSKTSLKPVKHLSGELALKAKKLLDFIEAAPKKKSTVHLKKEFKDFLLFCGLTNEQINQEKFNEKDLRYIWSRRCLYELGHNLTKDFDQAIDKAQALVDWIYLNVNSSPGRQNEWLGVMPGTLLMRGYGLCDRTAQLFAELGRQIGLETALYVLRDSQGVSPHTIAAFRFEDHWYFADTYNGIIYEDAQGQLLSHKDIMQNPEKLSHYKIFQRPNWHDGFLGGNFYWVFDYRGMTKKMYEISPVLEERYSAMYYLNFVESARRFNELISEQESFKCWRVSTKFLNQWDDPQLRVLLNLLIKSCSGGSMAGRLAQVSGYTKIALEKFTTLEEPLPLSTYYRAQCLYDLGRYQEAHKIFLTVLEEDFLKHFHAVTHIYLAMIEEAKGNKDAARKHWILAPNDQERVTLALKKF